MKNIDKFPEYFRSYSWRGNYHYSHGYESDAYPCFPWITSLEHRHEWVRHTLESGQPAPVELLKEMIHWGGNRRGILEKFQRGLEETDITPLFSTVIENLHSPASAIQSALQIPGMGLTYASKLLRFAAPHRYGALDSRIRKALEKCHPDILPRIYDGNEPSMVKGYMAFIQYLESLQQQLEKEGITRPDCALPFDVNTKTGWRIADVEMALFQWTTHQLSPDDLAEDDAE